MTPERWAQIEELFHRAADCEPAQRTSLLEEACRTDPDLRREIDALLSSDQSTRDHVQSAVSHGLNAFAFSLAGEVVSHYRILGGLGGGGMGLVYRAEDIRLGRLVALKFLPEESANNPVALARFEREARSASALEHPNICPIHEFGEHEGKPFLVMQLLEGETLRELLEKRDIEKSKAGSGVARRGRRSPWLDQVLDVAIQVADGLHAAHQKGIIHRDIKPANIFVTREGQVKMLDFGLAKLARDAALASDDSHESSQPPGAVREGQARLNPFVSQTGVAIGTAAYMSPEQVRGETLDARTDLFSFGLVLYEMATAQRAFSGNTGPELQNAILTRTPVHIRRLNPQIPAKLERVINKAIEKDREARYQSVSEMRADLQTLKREISTHRLRRWVLGSATIVVLFVAGAFLWLARRQGSVTQAIREIKFRQLTINSSDNPVTSGSISPNGKFLVYVDAQGLHVKDIETGATQGVPQPEALGRDGVAWNLPDAAWFPDSTRFIANAHPAGEAPDAWSSRTTDAWMFSRLGGTPQRLREHAYAGSVSPDGSLIPFGTSAGNLADREVWLTGPSGEEPRKLAGADDKSWFGPVLWSPDGKRGFLAKSDASGDTILSFDLRGGPPVTVYTPEEAKQVFPGLQGDPSWLPDGRVIYQLSDPGSGITSLQDTCNFWTMRFDIHTGKPIEQPKRLTSWTGFCISNANATADGKRLAFLASSSGHGTAYIADLAPDARHIFNRRHFTLDEGDDFITDWVDRNTVIVGHNRSDHYEIYRQMLNEDTPEPLVTTAPGAVENNVVSPDKKWVLIQVWPVSDNPSRMVPIVRVPITGGSPQEIFRVREGSLISCSKAPSSLCTVAEQSDDKKQMIITTFDAVKGRGHELARFAIDPDMDISHYLQGRVSPDGAHLFAVRASKGPIEIRSLRGGPTRTIQPKNVENVLVVGWAADGNGFYLTNRTKEGSEILYMDLHGNTKFLYKSGSKSYVSGLGGVPSPDGRHLAIYDLLQSANVWIMENY